MRFTGKLKTWNDDRGFGFITPTEGGQDIFVHISEFAKGRRPDLQTTLTFEVALNPQGKKKAVNVRVPESARAGGRQAGRSRRESGVDHRPGGLIGRILMLAIVGSLGWWGYQQYSNRSSAVGSVAVPADGRLPRTESPAAPAFSCDGRIYCSQMTSCAEATFFLKNCPGTKMDGNNDGVPCEQQWCK